MGAFIDLTGQSFGRLIVLKRAENSPAGKARWVVRCACGTHKVVVGSQLTSGHTQSCSCLHKEGVSALRKSHGMSRTPEYVAWVQMHRRCADATNSRYGGRGISVCERWKDFAAFIADMGKRPFPKAQVDRVDNALGYSPDNCQWATNRENSLNTRRNRYITHNGATKPLIDWATEHGINQRTLSYRLSRGMGMDEALTAPIKEHE